MSKYTRDLDYSQEDYSATSVIRNLDNDSSLEAERKAEAIAERKQDARFIGYEDVLNAYQARTDVEHLRDRRARHYGLTFDDQKFARDQFYDGVSGETADAFATSAEQEANYSGRAYVAPANGNNDDGEEDGSGEGPSSGI